ncbi:zinc finger protein 436-like [Schistocerca cancellata]|uniref:zinc finger protein 436-like n=1 Tax=Schistocerca cancellata TaxID=274614 RepID=UPI0021192612|nr:zinc finger protein 436-like [Schistocerca cancellata]
MDVTHIKKESTLDYSTAKISQQEHENDNEQTQEEYIFVKPELEDCVVEESGSAQDPLSLDSEDVQFTETEDSGLQQKSFIEEVKDVKLTFENVSNSRAQHIELSPNDVGFSRTVNTGYKVPNEDSPFAKGEREDRAVFRTVAVEEEGNSDLEEEDSEDAESEEQMVTCDTCRKGFPSRKAMVGHTCKAADVVAREGAALPPNACAACGEVLATAELARRHPRSQECPRNRQLPGGRARDVAEPGKFACDQCPARYGRRSHLLRHLRVHSGVKPFSCSTCGKAFLDPSSLKAHEATHTDDRPYVCGLCEKLFRQSAHLRAHLRTHTGERPFACEECGAAFGTVGTLAIHRRQHTGDRPYACSECPAAFTTASNLTVHRRTHTGERPHACTHPGCGRAFNTAHNLLSHTRAVHAGERPHACPQPGCGRRFSQISNLRSHTRAVHEHLRPYACDRCPASYSSASYLRAHRRSHTGERPYSCSSCGAAFATSGGLRQHERVHSGARPFVCPDCGNAYKQAGSLAEHRRSHTGDRPLVCGICSKTFAAASNFRKHRLMHERNGDCT